MKAGVVQKSMVPSLIGAILVSVAIALLVHKFETDGAVIQARGTAQAVAAEVGALRQAYSRNVVNKLKKDQIAIKPDIAAVYRDTVGGIPLPATFVHETSDIVNSKSKSHQVDLKSLWNINPKKKPNDGFETEALKFVADNPREAKESVVDDRFYYVVADVAADDSCVNCHNQNAASPRRDFQVNDVMGGMIISVPMGPALEQAKSTTIKVTLSLVGCIIALLLIQFGLQYATIHKPLITSLAELEKAAEQISLGKVEDPIKVSAPTAEISRLAAAFERMRSSLQVAMKYFEREEGKK
jgi:HAMP domain-containing protein